MPSYGSVRFSGGGRVRGGSAVDRGHFQLNLDWADAIHAEITRPKAEILADIGERKAYELAPKRTGAMAATIVGYARRSGNTMSAVVTVGDQNTQYWQYVEYGTGRLGGLSTSGRGSQTKVTSQGYKHGKEQTGMIARPFMRPALLEMRRAWNAGEV